MPLVYVEVIPTHNGVDHIVVPAYDAYTIVVVDWLNDTRAEEVVRLPVSFNADLMVLLQVERDEPMDRESDASLQLTVSIVAAGHAVF